MYLGILNLKLFNVNIRLPLHLMKSFRIELDLDFRFVWIVRLIVVTV